MTEHRLIRAVVAVDEALIRAALAAALDRHPDLEVVADPTGDAVEQAVRLRPDVVLLGAAVLASRGAAVCARVKAASPDTGVLVVGNRGDQSLLLDALVSGADGFVGADASLEELVEATRRVGAGEAFVPPQLLGGLLRWLIDSRRREDAITMRFTRLSRREREILGLLVEGKPLPVIAELLVISPDTARTHVQNVLKKLEVHSRVEAVALALEHGFTGTNTSAPSSEEVAQPWP